MARIQSLAIGLIAVAAVAGCVSVGIKTSGAATVEDLQAEEVYKAVYSQGMAAVHEQLQRFVPSGTNPGVCNAGGSQQGCFDADVAVIEAMRALASALEAATVPPRFVDADRRLRDAIAENIRGLELRNQAIANTDNAAWTEHKTILEAAQAAWLAAYEAFPADNRPMPPP